MAVEVKKKKGESFESTLRRFNKRIMQSGILLQFKKIRYYQKPISRNLRKNQALHRLQIRKKREFLQKIGLLPEDDARKKNKKRR